MAAINSVTVAARRLEKLRDVVADVIAQYEALGRDDRAALWSKMWADAQAAITAGTASDFEFEF